MEKTFSSNPKTRETAENTVNKTKKLLVKHSREQDTRMNEQ